MRRRAFLAGLALAGPASWLSTRVARAQCETPSEADIGYCRDMSIHHAQALIMCQRVLGRDTGDSVQAAAAEVLQNQAIEIGVMRAWLSAWGASTVPPTIVMGWMGANGGEGVPLSAMPGYATDEELLELSRRTGTDRGRRWLELMRAHHVGGVTMATRASELAAIPRVVRFAAAQASVQSFEITQYDVLLAGEYA